MSLIKISVPGFINKVFKTKGGLWVPMCDMFVEKHKNVLATLRNEQGILLIPGSNIVTDAGDLFFAQRGAAETPTNTFATLELCSAGTPGKAANRSAFTPIASTEKDADGTYPKTNDADADNTGAGTDIVTRLTSYAKADFSTAPTDITHGIVTNATPVASEPLLCGFAFGQAFGKTSNDTLKVFVNHQMNGI